MASICRDINQLTPTAQIACNLFLNECKKQGIKVLVTETYRSQERQNELYAQGRTKSGKIVTWTKKSRHTSRRAWDICQNVKGKEYSDNNFFIRCGDIAKQLNITWGGNWPTPDMPHFEIAEYWKVPINKEDEPMTQAERIKFNELVNIVENLTARVDELAKNNAEKIYHYWKELPMWAYSSVKKAYDVGAFRGASSSDLNLSETMMRIIVMNDRLGLYDKE